LWTVNPETKEDNMWNHFKYAGAVLLTALLVGVTTTVAAAEQTAATVRQLTGKGEWQSLSGDSINGTWAVTLVPRGHRIEGNLDLAGSNVFSGGAVSGTIDGSNVVLGVMADGTNQATFSGKLQGGSISGEWQSDAVHDSGVWSGTLSAGEPDSAALVQ
jgi:hypothetical protein